jgi:hypothetical protein
MGSKKAGTNPGTTHIMLLMSINQSSGVAKAPNIAKNKVYRG